jgi:coproporphyrinogen III oxidase-like Fe-S oxidoreductase
VPADGALPAGAAAKIGTRPFGIYVHVPFCTTRCGYCDFNTYTADEPGGAGRGAYPGLAIAEIQLARRVLGEAGLPVQTVFFGGGTPTLLAPAQLGAILRAIDGEFGLAPDAEVSTEANPESVDERSLAGLRQAGFTRISFGMQSAVPHVLATLDRVHSPERAVRCAEWAAAAGFGQVSLDLIYGTPGESDADWRRSVEAAVAAGPSHISAYSLIVEDGTRLAAQIRRGKLPAPDEDAMADKYLAADAMMAAAGLRWYEISNWAAGSSPGQAREVLTERERRTEQIMLLTRLSAGCPAALLSARGQAAAQAAVGDSLDDAARWTDGRVVLTPDGRLLADAVIRGLTE